MWEFGIDGKWIMTVGHSSVVVLAVLGRATCTDLWWLLVCLSFTPWGTVFASKMCLSFPVLTTVCKHRQKPDACVIDCPEQVDRGYKH